MIHKGNGVQIIYGPNVTVIKSNWKKYLETAPVLYILMIMRVVQSQMMPRRVRKLKEV